MRLESPKVGGAPDGADRASPGSRRPVVFGEVLFDHFPDGTQVLGGAPFNVAWHLKGFGADPLMLTAVGDDGAGHRVLSRMAEWGLDTKGVQIDTDHPTGRVEVSVVDGEPHFEIPEGQAWDRVAAGAARAAAIEADASLVYHGTLAVREAMSRRALREVIDAVPAPTMADVNLRAPWWSRDRVFEAIPRVGWLKLNQEELSILAPASIHSRQECRSAARRFADAHFLRQLIVTRGAEGSLWITDAGEVLEADAPEVAGFVDAVGAGDAFAAVLCLGVLERWPAATILARASRFAAAICEVRGATTADPSVYDRHLSDWCEGPAGLAPVKD
jgi:fructokinase